MHRYRSIRGGRLRYWKPIQTGIEQDDDTAAVRSLGTCEGGELLDEGVRLEHPVSPHLAAKLAGTRIDLSALKQIADREPGSDRWIVEGAGGVLVPIRDSIMMADLVSLFALPALVVARSTLGTINHTLLTIEALRARGIALAGVVMVGPLNPDNREAIETFGQVAVVGELPRLDPLTPDTLAAWSHDQLDPRGQLHVHFHG